MLPAKSIMLPTAMPDILPAKAAGLSSLSTPLPVDERDGLVGVHRTRKFKCRPIADGERPRRGRCSRSNRAADQGKATCQDVHGPGIVERKGRTYRAVGKKAAVTADVDDAEIVDGAGSAAKPVRAVDVPCGAGGIVEGRAYDEDRRTLKRDVAGDRASAVVVDGDAAGVGGDQAAGESDCHAHSAQQHVRGHAESSGIGEGRDIGAEVD